MPRPDHLQYSAFRVVKASRELSSGAKLVWGEIHGLDKGPEGCYMGAGRLADRLGMGRDNVEEHRRDLESLGLLTSRSHPGRRTKSWYPTLPPDCIPPPTLQPKDLVIFRDRLDTYVRKQRTANGGPDYAAPPEKMAYSNTPNAETGIPQYASEEGRGDPPSPKLETTLHPPLHPHDDGVGSSPRDARLERTTDPKSIGAVLREMPLPRRREALRNRRRTP